MALSGTPTLDNVARLTDNNAVAKLMSMQPDELARLRAELNSLVDTGTGRLSQLNKLKGEGGGACPRPRRAQPAPLDAVHGCAVGRRCRAAGGDAVGRSRRIGRGRAPPTK